MLRGLVVLGMMLGPLLACFAAGDDIVSLEEAAKRVNKDVTIEFVVKATGKSKAGDKVFLNSEADFKSEKNFTVLLTKAALTEMKKDSIDDAAAYFKGKKVQVYGTVKLYKDRPEIAIEKAGQITLPKGEPEK
jgi:DNA/RNA endonuclease YhcR with UshA esterase domain